MPTVPTQELALEAKGDDYWATGYRSVQVEEAFFATLAGIGRGFGRVTARTARAQVRPPGQPCGAQQCPP
jgi:hypothetical protein